MKVLVQWARRNPRGWEEVDARDWARLPKRPAPSAVGGQDDSPGHVRNVNVQGITAEGRDHIAIEPITIGNDEGVKYTLWNDDAEDYPIGQRVALVYTVLPLAPDPRLGMAINTRQSLIRYAEGDRYENWLANPAVNTTTRPWGEFVPPDDSVVRHGVWLTDDKFAEHVEKAPHHEWGWGHWCDHLPESETEIETEVVHQKVRRQITPRRKLKEQRAQGRYKKAEHTITYFQRDTNLAAGWDTATNENEMNKSTAGSATETVTTNSGSVEGWCFSTPASEPNSADWPDGTRNVQINITVISAGMQIRFPNSTFGGSNGHARVASDLSSVLELTNTGSENIESTTGLKINTRTSSGWTAGSEADRYGFAITALGDSHGDAVTLQFNTTDSYADGPWPVITYPLIGTPFGQSGQRCMQSILGR